MVEKHNAQLIIFLAVCNYLTEEQIFALKSELSTSPKRSNQYFLTILKKHFDIEMFLKKPFIWQDVWIYNHIMYDSGKSWSRKNGLLAKYEREILLPQKKLLETANKLLNQLD